MTVARTIPRDRRDLLGEGLWWSVREQAVYWVDILGQRLNRLVLAGEAVTSWTLPEMTGWVIEREHERGFIAGTESGFVALTVDPLTIVPLHDPEPDKPLNRMNDAVADASGAIWAGTMPIAADRQSGALYRLSPEGHVAMMDRGYTISNGPVVSHDGSTLYHTDTKQRTIYAFALHDDGSLGPRREHIAFEDGWGNPDGMTLDADGCLWVAHWGAGCVGRFDGDGRRQRHIDLPATQVTNCVFAGAALDRMFVTSAADGVPDEAQAGALFEVDPGVRGLPPHRYRG